MKAGEEMRKICEGTVYAAQIDRPELVDMNTDQHFPLGSWANEYQDEVLVIYVRSRPLGVSNAMKGRSL